MFAEDASTVHTGSAPRAMAALRNLAAGRLRLPGADNIAKTTRAIRAAPNTPSGSGASPTARSYRELEAALGTACPPQRLSHACLPVTCRRANTLVGSVDRPASSLGLSGPCQVGARTPLFTGALDRDPFRSRVRDCAVGSATVRHGGRHHGGASEVSRYGPAVPESSVA